MTDGFAADVREVRKPVEWTRDEGRSESETSKWRAKRPRARRPSRSGAGSSSRTKPISRPNWLGPFKFDFDAEDRRRVDELSAKAREGTLSEAERAEMEEYVRVDRELGVLQSKARLSLKRAGLKAR